MSLNLFVQIWEEQCFLTTALNSIPLSGKQLYGFFYFFPQETFLYEFVYS